MSSDTLTAATYIDTLNKMKAGLARAQVHLNHDAKNTKIKSELNQQYNQDMDKKTDRIIDISGLILSGLLIGGIAIIAIRRQV